MKLAMENPTGAVVYFGNEEVSSLLAESRKSPRRRMIQPIQRTEASPVQRMLNAFQPGTYVRPHRHPERGASETLVLLQGRLGVVIFDDRGEVLERYELCRGDVLDLEPMVWHSMVCLEEDTLISEFKCGPYDASKDKEFADWAPLEDAGAEWVRLMEQKFEALK